MTMAKNQKFSRTFLPVFSEETTNGTSIAGLSYNTLWNRRHALWKPLGKIQMVDLDNNYFLVKFEDVRDYAMVLTDELLAIYGS
ncbi:hypothetical protein V6N12_011417 [Hibiscus sabdariffa]|uniref:DUF4283 domain-containing protein n=1 Tax=Hibiscus sabdariffa TaxID=183260 RepID=A0ABR2AW20_9ROSI